MDQIEQADRREERQSNNILKQSEFEFKIWLSVIRCIALVISIFILCVAGSCSYKDNLKYLALTKNVDPYKAKMMFDGYTSQVDPNFMIQEMLKNKETNQNK